ncbi:MAG: GMC family oxidoreductase [Acidobacteriota bacterium]
MTNKQTFDAIVIGSGFGGAVLACRLSNAGLRVAVLERGRRWGVDFPRPGSSAPWRWNETNRGLFELRSFSHMDVIVAAGLGGGSLIYTNIQQRAHTDAFTQGWPAEITRSSLDPYYDLVEQMLRPALAPTGSRTALATAAQAAGIANRLAQPRLAICWETPGKDLFNEFGARQRGCTGCGLCVLGCCEGAKNTLDLNYLKVAEDRGALLLPGHEAIGIATVAVGYQVDCQVHNEQGTTEHRQFIAPRLVIAAGTLGSNQLLLRSKFILKTLPALSNALGKNFSGNGDFFAAALGTSMAIERSGPSVTAMLDYWPEGRFLLLEGIVPELFGEKMARPITALSRLYNYRKHLDNFWRQWFGKPLRSTLPDYNRTTALAHTLLFFLMGVDASDGELSLDKQGRLTLAWHNRGSLPLFRTMIRELGKLAKGLDAWLILSPSWWLGRRLATVHPLGGCAMSDDPAKGVVSPAGEVYGYPGLYVADGSLMPRAIGVPPSATIAALAERIAARLIETL